MLLENYIETYVENTPIKRSGLFIDIFDKTYRVNGLYDTYRYKYKDGDGKPKPNIYVYKKILEYKKHIERITTEGVIYQKDFHNLEYAGSSIYNKFIQTLKKNNVIFGARAKSLCNCCDLDPTFAKFENFDVRKIGTYVVLFTYDFFINNIKKYDENLKNVLEDMYGQNSVETEYNKIIRNHKLKTLLDSID